jgi:hypothetical protein
MHGSTPLMGRHQHQQYQSHQQQQVPQQGPLSGSGSPPGGKRKPELTLLIPNAAAEPPAPAPPNSLEIRVCKVSWKCGSEAALLCTARAKHWSYACIGEVYSSQTKQALLQAIHGGAMHQGPRFILAMVGYQSSASPALCNSSQELLSPAELRFVGELNHMDIPLHVTVDDPDLEPPLSTSR